MTVMTVETIRMAGSSKSRCPSQRAAGEAPLLVSHQSLPNKKRLQCACCLPVLIGADIGSFLQSWVDSRESRPDGDCQSTSFCQRSNSWTSNTVRYSQEAYPSHGLRGAEEARTGQWSVTQRDSERIPFGWTDLVQNGVRDKVQGR